MTEINILIKTIDLIKKVVKNCNSLKLNKLNIVCQNFIDYTELNKNNLIIGNPPYITYYGKRSRNMTEEKRKKFNQFDFVINKKGNNKFNSIMFFIENGIKSLKEHGRLIFIIIEKIKGKPVDPKLENTIHSIGFFLLMALMILITYNDIIRLIK